MSALWSQNPFLQKKILFLADSQPRSCGPKTSSALSKHLFMKVQKAKNKIKDQSMDILTNNFSPILTLFTISQTLPIQIIQSLMKLPLQLHLNANYLGFRQAYLLRSFDDVGSHCRVGSGEFRSPLVITLLTIWPFFYRIFLHRFAIPRFTRLIPGEVFTALNERVLVQVSTLRKYLSFDIAHCW